MHANGGWGCVHQMLVLVIGRWRMSCKLYIFFLLAPSTNIHAGCHRELDHAGDRFGQLFCNMHNEMHNDMFIDMFIDMFNNLSIV